VMWGAELWCGEIVRKRLCGFLEVSCGFCTIRSDAYQGQTGRRKIACVWMALWTFLVSMIRVPCAVVIHRKEDIFFCSILLWDEVSEGSAFGSENRVCDWGRYKVEYCLAFSPDYNLVKRRFLQAWIHDAADWYGRAMVPSFSRRTGNWWHFLQYRASSLYEWKCFVHQSDSRGAGTEYLSKQWISGPWKKVPVASAFSFMSGYMCLSFVRVCVASGWKLPSHGRESWRRHLHISTECKVHAICMTFATLPDLKLSISAVREC
jgi:hypothetical protein